MTIRKGERCFSHCHKCNITFEYRWVGIGKNKDANKFFHEHFGHGRYTNWADSNNGWRHAQFAGLGYKREDKRSPKLD